MSQHIDEIESVHPRMNEK